MQYIPVGSSGVRVSRICFGTLQMGSLISDMDLSSGVELLLHASKQGITTFDTDRSSGTRRYLRFIFSDNIDISVIDKSSAYTYEEIEQDICESLVELDRDELDIFLLSDLRSRQDFVARRGAWNYLIEAKTMDLVKAIGFSTHTVEGSQLASDLEELDFIEVVFNLKGIGILDGELKDMEKALDKLKRAGKTVCAIKPLGGGMLSRDHWKEALKFVFSHPLIDCVCIGMTTKVEVDINCAIANARGITERPKVKGELVKRLFILDWCDGCEACIPVCPTKALYNENGYAHVIHERCDWCGKCGPVCPEGAIFLVTTQSKPKPVNIKRHSSE